MSIYRQVIRFRHLLFNKGLLRKVRYRWPVISIGGIEAGGSGKTPIAIEIIRFLKEKGLEPVLLSRGYGRRSKGAILLQPNSEIDPMRIGDEPALIIQKTGVAAVIASERWRYISLVDELPGESKVIVMDDGFQHRFLDRDLDIVAVTGEIPISQRHYLPFPTRGSFARSLRDIPERLKAADLVLFKGMAQEIIHQSSGIFTYSLALTLDTQPVVVVTSIAEPMGFVNMLRNRGVRVEYHLPFRDHHIFRQKDLKLIEEICISQGVRKILTTEKDAVRLPKKISDIEIHSVSLELNLPVVFWDTLEKFCKKLEVEA